MGNMGGMGSNMGGSGMMNQDRGMGMQSSGMGGPLIMIAGINKGRRIGMEGRMVGNMRRNIK